MTDLTTQPLPNQGERVRVFVPHDVTFNLEKMNKITAGVLHKLGCPACHSGRFLDFVTLHDYVVNPQTLEVQAVAVAQAM